MASRQDEDLSIVVEVRSVNNRHFKLSLRVTDPYGPLEPDLERLVRDRVHRGSVQLSLRVDRPRQADDYRLNQVAILSYWNQLRSACGDQDLAIDAVLGLPGVVEENRSPIKDPHEDWPRFQEVVEEALAKLEQSRLDEGLVMATELLALGRDLADRLIRIKERGPAVVLGYQARLGERVRSLIEKHGVTVDPKDLIREIAIFAERSDIAEEITRLSAHLEQYEKIIKGPAVAGRKLEFVVQEMGRETNTIGSKANDYEISREIVEMKGTLERIRELIQNVE